MAYSLTANVSLGGTLHQAHIEVPGVFSWDVESEEDLLRLFGEGIFNTAASLKAGLGDKT